MTLWFWRDTCEKRSERRDLRGHTVSPSSATFQAYSDVLKCLTHLAYSYEVEYGSLDGMRLFLLLDCIRGIGYASIVASGLMQDFRYEVNISSPKIAFVGYSATYMKLEGFFNISSSKVLSLHTQPTNHNDCCISLYVYSHC